MAQKKMMMKTNLQGGDPPTDDDGSIAAIHALVEGGGEDILTGDEMDIISVLTIKKPLEFGCNLAECLDQSILDRLADDVIEGFDDDEQSRKDWFVRESDGIKMLGVSSDTIGGADFEGASRVVHPGLLEAVVQFQSRAMSELWPPEGPAKTVVLGELSQEKDEQAKRVANYLNYLYTQKMPGAYEHHDKMLFRLGFSGCGFKKIYYCPVAKSIVSRFCPAGDIVVPYSTVDIETCPRITHVLKYTHSDMLRMVAAGVYIDADLSQPDDEKTQTDQTMDDAIDAVEGKQPTFHYSDTDVQRHIVLEQSVYIDLPGYEASVPLPYLISVDKESRKTLAVYRHWKEDDESQRRRAYIIMYGFIPGFGFYHIGLLHFLGRMSEASSGALRALLDAAHFSNLPAGYRSRDARIKNMKPLAPGQWPEVDSTADDLGKAFFRLPYGAPSQTLFELLQYLDGLTRRLAGTTEDLVGDNSKSVPVGTTLARIDQGLKVQTAIQRRLHKAQERELKLVAELAAEFLPDERYSYDIAGRSAEIFAQDFDPRIDIVPVSDPNIITATQRLATGQALIDMTTQAPDLFDRRAVYHRMLESMRVQNIDELMPDKTEIKRMGPVEENIAMMLSKPVKAYPDQDHVAHQIVHQQWFMGLPKDQQQRLQAAHMAHLAEHQAWDYTLKMQQAMGMDLRMNPLIGDKEFQDVEMDAPAENAIALVAAQAAQLMAQQAQQTAQPDQAAQLAAQAATKAEAEEARIAADIRRKDMLAAASIARSDAESVARMNRDNAKREVALISRYLSPEATQAIEQPESQLP